MTRITAGKGTPNEKDIFVEKNLGSGEAERTCVIVRRKEDGACVKMVTEFLMCALNHLKENGMDIEYTIDGQKEIVHYDFGYDHCQVHFSLFGDF